MYSLTLNNEREMCQLTRKMREFVVVKFASPNRFHGIVYIGIFSEKINVLIYEI